MKNSKQILTLATLMASVSLAAAAPPVKVFILAGQSNMCGYGHTEDGQNNDVGGIGTLRYLAVHDSEYPEFGKPELPFVIATTGMGYDSGTSPPPYQEYHPVERAQLWVAGVEKPENVLTDDTRSYFEPPEKSPRNQGFHWNGNARSYFRVGKGLGDKMVEILGN